MSKNVDTIAAKHKAIMFDSIVGDSLQNLVASMGTSGDKRSHNTFVDNKKFSLAELGAMYRGSWIGGKIVDIIPDDMTREWRNINSSIDPKQVEQIEAEEVRLDLKAKMNEASKWGRLYGGALIIMVLDEGMTGTPDEPLDMRRVKKGALKQIQVVDSEHAQGYEVNFLNPFEENFNQPTFYRIVSSTINIHYTRVLRFDGVKLPFHEFKRNNYWGDSVFKRLEDSMQNAEATANSAAGMVFEANVDVIKVPGLMATIANPQAEERLRKRFALAKLLKSFNNLTLLDAEEIYETHTNNFAGLGDLLDRFLGICAAGIDIPATRFIGTSAKGLNATGDGDLKNYYDNVAARQTTEYDPKLRVMDEVLQRSLFGNPIEDWSYKWNSLFQLTDLEISTMELTNAQRDQIYLTNNVLTEDIIARQLDEDKVYTNITDEYLEELEELINLEPEDEDGFDEKQSEAEEAPEKEERNKESADQAKRRVMDALLKIKGV